MSSNEYNEHEEIPKNAALIPSPKRRFKQFSGPWRIALEKLVRDPFALFGLGGILLLILITIFAQYLAPYNPTELDRKAFLSPPTETHIFGTDELGRDILSRVLWGGKESLKVALLAVVIAVGGGTLVGLFSGFYGGRVDNLIQRGIEIFMAFPNILLVLTIITILGPSLTTVLIAAGFSGIPSYSRTVRSSVLSVMNMEYINSARIAGARSGRIIFRYLLPNVVAPIIVLSTVRLGGVIMSTAGLSYIGLGAQPPSAEWGAMLNYGRSFLRTAWWMSLFPGLAIFWAVLCVNLLGDGLRDALDPKLRAR